MNIRELINNRKSYRDFKDENLLRSHIDIINQVALKVPSAGGFQPLRTYFFTRESKKKFSFQQDSFYS